MSPDELRGILALGREQRNTEFKFGGLRTDKNLRVLVIRAILGMANTQDGGRVILGVNDDGTRLTPAGMSDKEIQTWKYDDLAASVAEFADPYVEFDVATLELDGKCFVIITVKEFTEYPVLCKKDSSDKLRRGAQGRAALSHASASSSGFAAVTRENHRIMRTLWKTPGRPIPDAGNVRASHRPD